MKTSGEITQIILGERVSDAAIAALVNLSNGSRIIGDVGIANELENHGLIETVPHPFLAGHTMTITTVSGEKFVAWLQTVEHQKLHGGER